MSETAAGQEHMPRIMNGSAELLRLYLRFNGPIEGEQQVPVLERGYRTVVQINAPLFPDRFLTIVPGSHLRETTPEERDVLANAPTGDMPGQLIVETQPGEVAFYYPNLLHRG